MDLLQWQKLVETPIINYPLQSAASRKQVGTIGDPRHKPERAQTPVSSRIMPGEGLPDLVALHLLRRFCVANSSR
jgi:hypothetical protein